jgi:hypothetical protein
MHPAISSIVLATAVLLGGCQLGPRPVFEPWQMPAGQWAVVDVGPAPQGVSDVDVAMASFGHVISFEPNVVRSGKSTCAEPRYLVSLMVADRYLRHELGVRASDLGLKQFQDLRISEVFCEGKRWRELGGLVLWIDHDRAYAVHDRTLYPLRRVGTPG